MGAKRDVVVNFTDRDELSPVVEIKRAARVLMLLDREGERG
jgi:hypothetical protein